MFFIRQATEYRFLPLFFDGLGFSESEIGFLMALNPLCHIFVSPISSSVADYKSSHRFMLIVSLSISAFTFPSLLLPQRSLFESCAAIALLHNTVVSVQSPLVTTLVLNSMVDKTRFGQQRVWGTVSWGITNALLGPALDMWGINALFVVYVASSVLLLLVVAVSPLGSVRARHEGDPAATLASGVLSAGAIPFQSIAVFSFFLLVFAAGAGASLIEGFLFIYLRNTLHASNSLLGASVALSVLFEIPIFMISHNLLVRFGAVTMIAASQLAFVVRVWSYSVIDNALWVCIVEPLHGISFGLLYSAGVQYSSAIVPPTQIASALSIFFMVQFGIGGVFALACGGVLIDSVGVTVTFQLCGFACLGVLSIFCFAARSRGTQAVDASDRADLLPGVFVQSDKPL